MSEILITTTTFGESGDAPLEILKEKGYSFRLNPYGRKLKPEELLDLAKDTEWVIAGTEEYSADTLMKLNSLKCISRVGVGVDSIDLKKAKELKINVINTPYGPTDAVAELAIALTLNLLRKINIMDSATKKGVWKKLNGSLLKGKRIGIVGFGKIGRRTASLFKSFGTKIIFYDPNIERDEGDFEKVELGELLSTADIILLHLSGGEDTKNFIGKEELGKLKRGAFIVNLSRGGILDENELCKALEEERIAGAALDVFEKEPYEGNLTKFDNVILTPHIGSYAREAKLQMEIDAVRNLLDSIEKAGKER